MRLLNGPLTLMDYALDFHSDYIICPFSACHGPTLVTVLMARLTSSKLTFELGNIEDKKLDKHVQGNMAESCFVLCIKLLEICIRMRGQILQGPLASQPHCFLGADRALFMTTSTSRSYAPHFLGRLQRSVSIRK